jgi:hypothetical protein
MYDNVNELTNIEGFTEEIDLINKKPFFIEDGTPILISFKGNIQNADKDEIIKFYYGTNLKTMINIKIEILNIFMQKALNFYKGQIIYETISIVKILA